MLSLLFREGPGMHILLDPHSGLAEVPNTEPITQFPAEPLVNFQIEHSIMRPVQSNDSDFKVGLVLKQNCQVLPDVRRV